jgi:putative colanic acid biosynthesis glycosyltransferase
LTATVPGPGDEPSFSIVTVVRNDRDGFAATAASIHRLTGVRWDWIVIDGASTDGTVECIRALATDPAHWVSEPDRGVYDAMNKGLHAATCDYVVFMNAGDEFRDAASLAHVRDAIVATGSRPAMVFGDTVYRFPSGRTLHRRARPIGECLWHRMPSTHQTTVFRADLHRAVRYDPDLLVCADYEVICRIFALDSSCAYVRRPIAVTSQRGESLSHRQAGRRIAEAMKVQRRVLGSSRRRIALSAAHRFAAAIAEYVLAREPNLVPGGWRAALFRPLPPDPAATD